ncbi:hypothetical protein LAZ67_X004300 [Cordylochernes scorpioides]|uniref:GIY-YIG homing endonuclease n=1 Tax=Cordylochernes scorpioides TaxID=51811 RepID=A0ABY6LY51_9ARAC|nr:hypothetical protein LAZ67_X004300 [Cordylochernes scorpioides]
MVQSGRIFGTPHCTTTRLFDLESKMMSKQRLYFDRVSEFDRGRRIVAYRDCGFSFREIGSRVGRNQTTVMRICDSWMQEEWNEIVFTDESQFCLQHHDGRIRVWKNRGERMLNSCVMHRHIGPASGIMVWGGIGYHSRTPLVRIAGTLNSQRYIFESCIVCGLIDPTVDRNLSCRCDRFFVLEDFVIFQWPLTFRAGSTVRNTITKQKVEIGNTKDVVYRIPCKSCNVSYIGETGRFLGTRLQEHKSSWKYAKERFAMVEHGLRSGHQPDWENTSTIYRGIQNSHHRKFLEAIASMKDPASVNRYEEIPEPYLSLLT